MLTIQDLSFHYGSRTLYDEASLQIKPKQRIGLIGQNGTGKTTLLKIINGELLPDGGTISKSNDCTIGFLNQDLLSYDSGESILNVAMQAFTREIKIQEEINQVIHQLENEYDEKLVEKLTKLQEEFEALGGYTMQSKTEEILEGLGFKTADLQRPLRTFSGGWRMRVMLAKLLLQNPAVLMLDEPTNHLDLPSIQWIESYLTDYEGAVIIVSHDRTFLDRAVNTIVEVSYGKLNVYSGNYTFYLQEKELRNELQRNAFNNQQQQIRQMESFINRFRAQASKSRQVQSRVKQLEKLDLVDEVMEETVALNFRFRFTQQPGKIIAELPNFSKSYGENVIFKNAKATIQRGDKIALIGANGKGKSTMLRIVSGTEPIEGEHKMGHNVIASFYAQHQLESLQIENQILDELKQAGTDKTEAELRNILGCFLFKGDDAFKKIKVLSGGEKSRVALAKTLISEANFLLLDEPTNHLDMQSVNILIQALQQYEGSYLIVSHDRHFISQTANKIWWVENGELKEYLGTYQEYEYWQKSQTPEKQSSKKVVVEKASPKNEEKSNNQQQREENKDWRRKVDAAKKRVSDAEKKISEIENKMKQTELELAKPSVYADPFKLSTTTQEYEKLKKQLEKANQEWEDAVMQLEEVEKSN
jgi:ATP-binding cassette subfamily F protein 3